MVTFDYDSKLWGKKYPVEYEGRDVKIADKVQNWYASSYSSYFHVEVGIWAFPPYHYEIEQVTLPNPAPDPEHTYTRQYFSNQLVSTYVSPNKKNTFECIAELNEDGRLTWKTTPYLGIVYEDTKWGQIISIKPILSRESHYYTLMVVSNTDSHEIRRFHVKSLDISKDILDAGWRGIDGADAVNIFKLRADTRKLLPKLPHYLNVLFGGNITIEEEHNYDKEGKIKDTTYRMLTITNRQDKNPLVRKTQALKRTTNPTYTIAIRG